MMTCAFCRRTEENEVAQNEFWEPFFWTGTHDGAIMIDEPVCNNCPQKIQYSKEHGDYHAANPVQGPIHVLVFHLADGQESRLHYLACPSEEYAQDLLAGWPDGVHMTRDIVIMTEDDHGDAVQD